MVSISYDSIIDLWHKLTPTDIRNLISHVIAIGCILSTLVFLDRQRIKGVRESKLTDYIRKARQEKDEKEHQCLQEPEPDQNQEILTASETRQRILAGTLDPAENVKFLAHRCKDFNWEKKGVNAIAEEFYDEVRTEFRNPEQREQGSRENAFGIAMEVGRLDIELLHSSKTEPYIESTRCTY